MMPDCDCSVDMADDNRIMDFAYSESMAIFSFVIRNLCTRHDTSPRINQAQANDKCSLRPWRMPFNCRKNRNGKLQTFRASRQIEQKGCRCRLRCANGTMEKPSRNRLQWGAHPWMFEQCSRDSRSNNFLLNLSRYHSRRNTLISVDSTAMRKKTDHSDLRYNQELWHKLEQFKEIKYIEMDSIYRSIH